MFYLQTIHMIKTVNIIWNCKVWIMMNKKSILKRTFNNKSQLKLLKQKIFKQSKDQLLTIECCTWHIIWKMNQGTQQFTISICYSALFLRFINFWNYMINLLDSIWNPCYFRKRYLMSLLFFKNIHWTKILILQFSINFLKIWKKKIKIK